MIGIWFGNFFEPFYSDRESVRRGIAEVAALGFTTLNLDSKPWEDFFARYRGEPASPYVGMQEFMMQEAAARGLDYTHLALYLCGDNLYPAIRNVPPVRGEEPVRPNGELMGTYKYWSPRAQATMVEHVRGLLKLYGKGMRRREGSRIIMQTMFEPIPETELRCRGRATLSCVARKTLRRRHREAKRTVQARLKILRRTQAIRILAPTRRVELGGLCAANRG